MTDIMGLTTHEIKGILMALVDGGEDREITLACHLGDGGEDYGHVGIYDAETLVVDIPQLYEPPLTSVVIALTSNEPSGEPGLVPLEQKALDAAKSAGTGIVVISVSLRRNEYGYNMRILDVRSKLERDTE